MLFGSCIGITFDAIQLLANESGAAFVSKDPGSECPRRVMPDMAGVPAIQVRYPITKFVLVKADNASFHSNTFRLWVLPGLAVRAR
jgi:hypothetical protein